MPLSDTAVQNFKARPGKRVTKHHDRDGLSLHISPTGTKSWVLRYRIHGKERSVALGRYPAVTLKKARERAHEARSKLADGIDPVLHKRSVKQKAADDDAARFMAVSEEWQMRQSWSDPVRRQYERLFRIDIYPSLGRFPVAEIDSQRVQLLIDKVAERGKVVAAHVLLLVRGALSHAVAQKHIPYNVAREVRPPKRAKGAKQSYRHLEGSTAVREMLLKLDRYNGQPETRIGLCLLLLTFVRPSELREAHWKEFDLDALGAQGQAAPTWTIGGERMKRGRPHVVPLSRQAAALLRSLRELTGSGPLLFPHARKRDEPMNRNTFIRALRDYMSIPTTAHGFRHLASTTLNGQGFNRDWIEMQLAHWNEGARGSYNKAQWLPERREMMQSYADWLDRLRDMPSPTPSLHCAA